MRINFISDKNGVFLLRESEYEIPDCDKDCLNLSAVNPATGVRDRFSSGPMCEKN